MTRKRGASLYVWLKQQAGARGQAGRALRRVEERVKPYTKDAVSGGIKWKFGKFLIDRGGNMAARAKRRKRK